MSRRTHDSVRDAVLRRLDLLERAAGHADPSTLLPLARTEINRLADGWRLLLTVHRCDEEGRCRACPTGTRGRWPCQIWRMAHEQLIGEGATHRERTRPLHNSLGRLARAFSERGTRRGAVPPESPEETTVRFPPVRRDLPGPRQR